MTDLPFTSDNRQKNLSATSGLRNMAPEPDHSPCTTFAVPAGLPNNLFLEEDALRGSLFSKLISSRHAQCVDLKHRIMLFTEAMSNLYHHKIAYTDMFKPRTPWSDWSLGLLEFFCIVSISDDMLKAGH